MFAVIKTGGKQYRVVPGDRFTVERLAAEPGDTIRFDEVLMLGGDEVTVGTPTVEGAAVAAEVVEQTRGPKLLNFKRRRRKASSKRLKGHRQDLTLVEITEILAKGGAKDAKAAIGVGAARRAGLSVAVHPAKAESKTAKAETKAAKAESEPAAEAEAKPKKGAAKAAKAEAPADAPKAARPGNLLEAAKGDADDLTKLSGVGPKLAEKLNASGVFHFWQIAEWTDEEVAHMDEQLSFKGRITRDDWIGQAKTLAADKN
ncbi:MAG TPA: 50S ribosomal protein L21 [Thermohalobaculum sp.]|nr:50S ribosomal protein L21 [Thermohalobaculum sp.]